jgi:hypothetical protein
MPEFNPSLVSPEDFLGIAQNRIKDTEAELRRAREKGNENQAEEVAERLEQLKRELKVLQEKVK